MSGERRRSQTQVQGIRSLLARCFKRPLCLWAGCREKDVHSVLRKAVPSGRSPTTTRHGSRTRSRTQHCPA